MKVMRKKHVPSRLRQVIVALVGAHAAGLMYLTAAVVTTGTVSLTTPLHWVILALSVGGTVSVAWPFVKVGGTASSPDDELEERYA